MVSNNYTYSRTKICTYFVKWLIYVLNLDAQVEQARPRVVLALVHLIPVFARVELILKLLELLLLPLQEAIPLLDA